MSPLTVPVGPRDRFRGPAAARVVLLEYGDFECPNCGEAYPLIKQIQQVMGERLRFVYRHFPLTRLHPHAEHAAEMAEAAGQHGKFWPMHDMLFEHQDALEDEDLLGYAAALGIDPDWGRAALGHGRFERKVREDFQSGVRSGVNGTPTFFINGQRYDGGWDDLLETLTAALDARTRQRDD